jgi:hypothetical protein
MSYKKLNNITGWAVCIVACLVYLLTMEGTISFWDCGEFAAGAVKLEVVHSPGAPLFLLIGRFFAIIFGSGNEHIAINAVSALSSGFTILFLFWTITHFARRIALRRSDDNTVSSNATVAIMASGIIGALAYTFSDTFWFSAVEAEVYAMSSLLTALVFWAILKWEDKVSEGSQVADRWIVFIAFVIGLSIGVHLLNLLTIPAIVMVYYFKKREVTTLGTLIAFAIGCAITGIVQIGVIQYIPKICSAFDVFFVNSLGTPFNFGVYFVLLLLGAISVVLLLVAKKKNKYFLHLGTLSFIFILIGYSSYFQTVIRSNVEVPIDMTNPDNAAALVDYLGRSQYGSIPHLSGPDFTAGSPISAKEGGMQYWKGEEKYIELGKKQTDYVYRADKTRIFPRVWDGNSEAHIRYYQNYLGLAKGEDPTAKDNLDFFFGYQVNQMWWRYFCWNYIGRQNDFQNIIGEPQTSNWLSGVKFIDKNIAGRGDVDVAPEMYSESKARNEFYFLPFILGFLGLLFHIQYDKRNAFVVGLLFFFTGLAIVIYLNNTPMQPRERDYAYAGATYAFAIWIGLGMLMVQDWLQKFLKGRMGTYAAFAICLLAVPVLMAFKGWDDHDRSDKTLARDTARNYLASLDKNAILFTEGDNDTYPLWYAQEVEGLRTDVRIVNLSLLGIDWYVDQLNNATNDSKPIPMIWKPEDYRGNYLGQARYVASDRIDANAFYPLTEVLQYLNQTKKAVGPTALPIKNFSIPVNKENIQKSGILAGRDSLLQNAPDQINFKLPRDYALKNDLAVLNILAANDWKRPIYFANSIDRNHYEGLGEYLELEGLVFKLVPKRTPGSNTQNILSFNEKKCIDWVLKDLKFGNAHKGTVYYNQTNRRMLNGIRIATFQIAENLIRSGKKKEATQVLDHMMKNIHPGSYPISITQMDNALLFVCDKYIKAGATKQANELADKLIDYTRKQVKYFNTLKKQDQGQNSRTFADTDFCRNGLGYLVQSASINNMKPLSEKLQKILAEISTKLPNPQQAPQR